MKNIHVLIVALASGIFLAALAAPPAAAVFDLGNRPQCVFDRVIHAVYLIKGSLRVRRSGSGKPLHRASA